jgi:ABC-type lipoprotein export system ATPase subunit
VLRLFDTLHSDGQTLIIVTHDRESPPPRIG